MLTLKLNLYAILILFIDKAILINTASIYEQVIASSEKLFTPSQDILVIGNGINGKMQMGDPSGNPKALFNLDAGSMINWSSVVQKLKTQISIPLAVLIDVDDPFPILQEFGKPVFHPRWQFFIIVNKQLEVGLPFMGSLLTEYLDLHGDVYILSASNETVDNCYSGFKLVELYTFRNTTFFQSVTVTACQQLYNEILRKASRRRNFRKLPVVGAVPTFIGIGRENAFYAEVNSSTGEVTLLSGFRVEEFFNMRDSLNFTAKGFLAEGFANLGPDGRLTGIGKQISDGNADVGIPSAEMMSYRLNELTFLHPSSSSGLSAYFKQLPATSYRDIYFQAFQAPVWIVFFIAWTTFMLAVVFFIWVGKCLTEFESDEGSTLECILFTIGVACQQGCFRLSSRGPKVLNIVCLIGVIASFVTYTAYCGSLVSTLSNPVDPISSFQDIIVNKFNIYALTDILVAGPVIASLQKQHEWMNRPSYLGGKSPYINDSEVLPKIMNSKSAVLVVPRKIHGHWDQSNVSDQFLCNEVSRVPIPGEVAKSGMIVKKGSPLKEVLNHHILQMFERGIRHRIETRFAETARFCCVRTKTELFNVNLGLKDVCTAIIILIGGFCLSFIIFCFEKLIGEMRRQDEYIR